MAIGGGSKVAGTGAAQTSEQAQGARSTGSVTINNERVSVSWLRTNDIGTTAFRPSWDAGVSDGAGSTLTEATPPAGGAYRLEFLGPVGARGFRLAERRIRDRREEAGWTRSPHRGRDGGQPRPGAACKPAGRERSRACGRRPGDCRRGRGRWRARRAETRGVGRALAQEFGSRAAAAGRPARWSARSAARRGLAFSAPS